MGVCLLRGGGVLLLNVQLERVLDLLFLAHCDELLSLLKHVLAVFSEHFALRCFQLSNDHLRWNYLVDQVTK